MSPVWGYSGMGISMEKKTGEHAREMTINFTGFYFYIFVFVLLGVDAYSLP
jgi:hypothetical protein